MQKNQKPFLMPYWTKLLIKRSGWKRNGAVKFFTERSNKIELLQGLSPDSAISKFIEKKGEGIHHIAFAVDDIDENVTTKKRRISTHSWYSEKGCWQLS